MRSGLKRPNDYAQPHWNKRGMTTDRSDAFVFFGATGDLAFQQIFPALAKLIGDEGFDLPIIGGSAELADDTHHPLAARSAARRLVQPGPWRPPACSGPRRVDRVRFGGGAALHPARPSPALPAGRATLAAPSAPGCHGGPADPPRRVVGFPLRMAGHRGRGSHLRRPGHPTPSGPPPSAA